MIFIFEYSMNIFNEITTNKPEGLVQIVLRLTVTLLAAYVTSDSICQWKHKVSLTLEMLAIADKQKPKENVVDKLHPRVVIKDFTSYFCFIAVFVLTATVPVHAEHIPGSLWFTTLYFNGTWQDEWKSSQLLWRTYLGRFAVRFNVNKGHKINGQEEEI